MIKCDIKFGYTCNNQCVHCVVADDRRALEDLNLPTDLGTGDWRAILDTYRDVGAEYIVLTGGEVTIRPDFAEIVDYCCKSGLFIGLQSNGRAFADAEMCRVIEPVERIYCTIAIHGSTAAIHDAITGERGSFDQTVAGLRNLRAIGKGVTAKIVISKFNMHALPDILDLLDNVDIKQANFAFPHALGDARINFIDVVPRYQDIKPVLKHLVEKGRQLGIGIEFEAIPFCIVPDSPECVTEIYDLEKSIRLFKPVASTTLDWNEVRPAIKKKGKDCDQCLYGLFCEGCWSEYVDHFGDEELEPVKEASEATIRLISAVAALTADS
ncbi:MAG: radical SAM protein [Chlorobiaceae bacterium]|nr:radical SAM protein [Chlorobiaceae bacterium]